MSAPRDASYDRIGTGYSRVRRADPRIAALVEAALGDAVTVLNVGAGSGSYESPQRRVVALEPAATMIRQRARDAAPCVVGVAEALPFLDASVDACTGFLTTHHWRDLARGLAELRRVARGRVVLLTVVPDAVAAESRWLTDRYFPGIAAADRRLFPALASGVYERALGPCTYVTVPVPGDCADGFLDAYWSRPEAYLDESVRAGISGFRLLPERELADGLAALARDLASGDWDARHGALRTQATFDAALRLVIARYDDGSSIAQSE